MPRPVTAYLRAVEALNYRIGRLAMWSLFLLMAVLGWGAIARAGFSPQIWTDEMAQFLLLGYFMLGGAYALQMGSAVRMDLLYSRWSLFIGIILFPILILLDVIFVIIAMINASKRKPWKYPLALPIIR